MWKTLPEWFWAIYYLAIFLTIVKGIYNVMGGKIKKLSILAIIIAIAIPVVSIGNSIGREGSINEFQYLIKQMQSGYIWASCVVAGYLYLIIWWLVSLFFPRKK